MKGYISFVLLLSFVGILWAQDDVGTEGDKGKKAYEAGYLDGYVEGYDENQLKWGVVGCTGGLVGSVVGGGIVWYVASRSGNIPDSLPEGDEEYIRGFIVGYEEVTKEKRAKAALSGCVVGTLTNATIIAAFFFVIWAVGMGMN